MRVEKFTYNDYDDLNANTYVVIDGVDAVVIDPSINNDKVGDFLVKNNLTLKAALLTHGHFDHIRGVDRLINRFNCPLYIHFDDEEILKDTYLNCSYFDSSNVVVNAKAITVTDKEIIDVLSDKIEVIHTPFHTRGSVCYYFTNNKLLFSGDTLFAGSIGRDDFPNSISKCRKSSLDKLKRLPKEIKIYPGHGENTVLEREIALNHFLQY